MRWIPRSDCQIPALADLYERYLPDAGSFVEVGAYDGVTVSNTVFLAEAGWLGLYVEPQPKSAELCAKNHQGHPNITVARTAISNFIGEAYLYDVGECSSLVDDKSTRDWGARPGVGCDVPVTTLDTLLLKLKWPVFDLLVIDVEQSELQVLEAFTIQHWQPRLVIIEAHERDPAPERNFKAAPISAWFEKNDYRKIYADHINSVYRVLKPGGHTILVFANWPNHPGLRQYVDNAKTANREDAGPGYWYYNDSDTVTSMAAQTGFGTFMDLMPGFRDLVALFTK